MNVLMTAYPESPLWTYAVELVRGLEREGAHTVVAVMDGPLHEYQRAELRTLRNAEFYESSYRAEWNGADEREIEAAGAWLLELERRHDIDVVHLNEFSHGARAWHSQPVIAALRRPCADLPRERVQRSLAAAGALVAPLRSTLAWIDANVGRARREVLIPFGRSPSVFANRTKEPMILTSGEYGDGTGNVGALTSIASRMSWPVFIIGDAPNYREVGTSLANSHFLGSMTDADASAVIARASVFVEPVAVPEDGYCIVEAASCSCALVLADVPELREQWEGAAAFVEPNDLESLRSTLIWLMNNAEARGDLGARARHRAGAFTTEKMAGAYLALYIDLALNAAESGAYFGRAAPLDRRT